MKNNAHIQNIKKVTCTVNLALFIPCNGLSPFFQQNLVKIPLEQEFKNSKK
jgi:hypothetical protein